MELFYNETIFEHILKVFFRNQGDGCMFCRPNQQKRFLVKMNIIFANDGIRQSWCATKLQVSLKKQELRHEPLQFDVSQFKKRESRMTKCCSCHRGVMTQTEVPVSLICSTWKNSPNQNERRITLRTDVTLSEPHLHFSFFLSQSLKINRTAANFSVFIA